MALLLNANDTVSRSYSYTMPSPNHISEVQSVGDYDSETGLYKIPVVTRGKNLIDVANVTGKTDTLFTDNVNPKLAQVKFDEATQYTISMKFIIDTRLGWRKITFTYTDGTTSVSPWIAASGLFKYTSTSGKTIAKVEFTNYNYYGDVSVEYIQLEAGTEATEYEPYHEPITTPIYLDAPLYKIGNYADRLSNTEEVRVVKELVLTGEERWDLWNGNYFSSVIDRKGAIDTLVCSHFINSSANGISYGRSAILGLKIAAVAIPFVTSVSELKTWLATQYAAGTPVKVYYVLATPETKTVEPVQIPTLNGTTVIDVDTAVKPTEMYIKYKSSK